MGQQIYLFHSVLFGICRMPSLPSKSGCFFLMINRLKIEFPAFPLETSLHILDGALP